MSQGNRNLCLSFKNGDEIEVWIDAFNQVQLALDGMAEGFSMALTPDLARQIAATLVRTAEEAERRSHG